MRILKLHHHTGHPYWDKDEYKIELPSGEIVNINNFLREYTSSYRIIWNNEGIWVKDCACGSGFGKLDRDFPPSLVVSSSEYDKIEFVGEEKVMSDELKQDLIDNGISY